MLTAEEWRRIGDVYGVDVGPMLREADEAREAPGVERLRRICEWAGVRLDDAQLRALALELEEANGAAG